MTFSRNGRHAHIVAGGALSPRERQIVCLLWEGFIKKEIAQRFGCSIKTVETHVSNIYVKSASLSQQSSSSSALSAKSFSADGQGQQLFTHQEDAMGQASSVLRKIEGGYGHWCPACEEIHPLPNTWQFDGNLEKPTFSPSFKHEGGQIVKVAGKWTGEWVRDANGNLIPFVCHYIVTAGVLNFCSDCTHSFAGKSVELPKLPDWLTDEGERQ